MLYHITITEMKMGNIAPISGIEPTSCILGQRTNHYTTEALLYHNPTHPYLSIWLLA